MAFLIWVLKKNWLLIILFTIISWVAGSMYGTANFVPQYEAKALLMVVNSKEVDPETGISTEKIDYMTLMANRELAKTYSDAISSTLVLEPVAAALNNKVALDELRLAVTAQPVGNSELIEVRVVYPDAEIAAEIANTTAATFIQEVNHLFKVSNVKSVDTASVNWEPATPSALLYPTVSAMAGLILIFLSCLAYNYWRQPVREEDVKGLAAPIVGRVTRIRALKRKGLPKLMAARERLRNQFWHIQTLLLQKTGRHKVVLVTSASKGEGKSTVCLGLALAFAHSGLSAVLIDASLGSPNPITALNTRTNPDATVHTRGSSPLRLIEAELNQVRVISMDIDADNAYPIFTSEVFAKYLSELADEYDLVLIDGPPLLDCAEALLLASLADGVLLVVKEGIPGVRLSDVSNLIKQTGTAVYGTVMNRGAGRFMSINIAGPIRRWREKLKNYGNS